MYTLMYSGFSHCTSSRAACTATQLPQPATLQIRQPHSRTCVEFDADCFEEADVVAQHLFIAEVKIQVNDVVDVVVAEQEKDARLAAHILDDDAQRLQHLQETQAKGKHPGARWAPAAAMRRFAAQHCCVPDTKK